MINSVIKWEKAKSEIEELKKKMGSGRYRSERTLTGFRNRLKGLEADVAEYEELREKGTAAIPLKRPEDIMLFPIRYRIAKGMSLSEFGKMTGIEPDMLWRIESNGYHGALGHTMFRVLSALPIKVDSKVWEIEQSSSN